jgi:modulator of FtsH protease HflC
MNAAHPGPSRAGGRSRATLWLLATAACAVLVLSALASVFTLDITEHGMVTRFGRVVRLVEEPGLGFKLPFERVQRFDKRLLFLSTQPNEYVTADRKNVIVATLATWRIAEPTRFLATLRTRGEAEQRLTDAIVGEAGAVIGRHDFASFVAPHASDNRFGAIIAEVRAGIQALVWRAYGIEVVDLGVRDLGLPQQNRQSVFERMKAERARITMQLRSEGKAESKRIIAEADRQKTRILAEANELARRLDGEGEAEAMRIYAREFAADLPFFKLIRTLEAYDRILDDKTTLFLPAESELLQILQPSTSAAEALNPPPKAGPRNGEMVGAGAEGQQRPPGELR